MTWRHHWQLLGQCRTLSYDDLRWRTRTLLEHFQKGLHRLILCSRVVRNSTKRVWRNLKLGISVRNLVKTFTIKHHCFKTKQINVVFDKKEIEKEIIGHWDRPLLNRAIMNIVSNAVEHTPSGSQLTVHQNRIWWIQVYLPDSGPGFSLNLLKRRLSSLSGR